MSKDRKGYYELYNVSKRAQGWNEFHDWFMKEKKKLAHDYSVRLTWSLAFEYVEPRVFDYMVEYNKYKPEAIRELVKEFVKDLWKKNKRT